MTAVARFVTRGCDKKDGLFIGVKLKGWDEHLKPGRIYEIQDWLGELVIKDIGPSAIKTSLRDYDEKPYRLLGGWGSGVEWILECIGKSIFLTEDEATEDQRRD
jgi:hypothetical protein